MDRGEQSQLRRVLQYYHLPIKETAAGLQHENIRTYASTEWSDHKEDHSGRCMVEGGVGTASAYG